MRGRYCVDRSHCRLRSVGTDVRKMWARKREVPGQRGEVWD